MNQVFAVSTSDGNESMPPREPRGGGPRRAQWFWILATSIVVIGIGVLAVTTVLAARRNTIANEMSYIEKLSQMLSEQSHRIIFGVDLVISALEDEMDLAGVSSSEDFQRYVKSESMYLRIKNMVIHSADVDAIGFIDADGIAISTSRSWPSERVDVSLRPYFVTLRDNPELISTISSPIKSKVTGQNIIVFARRLNAPNKTFLGVVLGVISANRIEELFRSFVSEKNAQASLFRLDHTILGQQPKMENILERDETVWRSVLDGLNKSDLVSLRATGMGQKYSPQMIAVSSVTGYPLLVSITRSEDDVLVDWSRLTIIIIIFTLTLSTLVIVMGVIFSRISRSGEARYRQLFEGANDSIFIIDPEERCFTDMNGNACKRLGYAYADLVGKPIGNILNATSIDHFLENGAVSTTENSYVFEAEHVRKDGSVMPVEISSRLINLGDTRVIQHIARDITERKQTQAQLIQSSKLATLGEMATGMAHELNQPLNIIQMAAENLKDITESGTVSAEDIESNLERIIGQTERASSIITHMRIFGRKDTLEQEYVNVCDAVNGAIDLVQEQIRLAGIELTVTLPDSCRLIRGQQVQLEQVLLNLLTNARDSFEESNTGSDEVRMIFIKVEDDKKFNKLKVIVQDSGGGVSDEALGRIFDPFFTTKDVGKGTGLGLSISYGIVSRMGGKIDVSNIGGGARFTITLPTVEMNT